jgi:tetratricopeptide (TPR) repeat protein
MKAAVALLAAAAAFASPAPAQENSRTFVISDVQAAQILIVNNRLDDARRLLERVLAANPDDREALFLLATIAVAQKDYDTAISLYRRILVQAPDTERVRLELARAFFLKGDYDNADRQFRFARAGDIDDVVKANIDHFLAAINRLREWTVNFSLALAPDTNQNAATSASQVSIYGLPFTLDKSARKQSGIGVAGDIGGEWSPLLSDSVKARIGGDLSRTDYSGGQFDDMTLSGYAGPQLLFQDWDISLLGTGFERWYANQDYLTGFGGKIAADYGITSDLLISAAIGGQAVTNDFIPQQSGPLYSTQLAGTYVLSPSSLFQLQLGFNRQDAQIGAYSYSGVWFGAGYSQDLPFGFSAGFQPVYFITRYDDALAAFGKTRADNALMLAFTALNRRFDYHGFTPRFSYIFTQQHSNIPIYSFTRNQFQVGVTSLF